MLFKDISISFSNYFGRHDPEKYKAKNIHNYLNKIEVSFLSYLPKKVRIAELAKLNINFGPKDPQEKRYWHSEGVGMLNKEEQMRPEEFLRLSDKEKSSWAITLIENELCLLANNDEVKGAIRHAARCAIESDFKVKGT